MDSHQWALLLFLLSFLIFAIAESASNLLNKHRLQVVLDLKRIKSPLSRLLIPESAGKLRSTLQFGKQFFLVCSLVTYLLTYQLTLLDAVIIASVAVVLSLYLPVLLAFSSPRLVISFLLPAVKYLNVIVIPLDYPRNRLFSFVRARVRKITNDSEDHDEEQLKAYLGEAEEEGLFEPDEAEMVRQIVEFGDTVVKEVMTPRVSIDCVDHDMDLREFSHFAAELKFSRYPVIKDKIDNVIGTVHIKDLLGLPLEKLSSSTVKDISSEPYFVPESKRVSSLLRDFQNNKQQMAIVVDEYGGTAGIITLEDILEELVGEIEDEHDKEDNNSDIQENQDGSLTVSGNVDVTEIERIFDADLDDEAYETISGLALNHLKHIPEKGEEFVTDGGIKIEILDANERSINKLKLTKMDENE